LPLILLAQLNLLEEVPCDNVVDTNVAIIWQLTAVQLPQQQCKVLRHNDLR